jgi:methylated-DNA-[protein]-cysteine S-methyltransferase
MSEFVEQLVARANEEGLLDVAYATLDTPLGKAAVAATPLGLVRVALPNESLDQMLTGIAAKLSPRILEYPARLDDARRELEEYFEGQRDRFELRLDWRLSHPGFYRRVLRATSRVPFGEMITYRDAAERAGNPRAFRAAGTAVGSNPIPIVVPCHRVIRSDGEIGNYGGGPEMKRFLLQLEGAV